MRLKCERCGQISDLIDAPEESWLDKVKEGDHTKMNWLCKLGLHKWKEWKDVHTYVDVS